MLTTNNWDLSVLTAAEREWVEANCVAVSITEPVYDTVKAPDTGSLRQHQRPTEKRRRAGAL